MIEILVAFVLLTFLLTGLVTAGLFAIKNSQFARNKSQATKLASQQLERARVLRDSSGVGIMALPTCVGKCFLDTNLVLTNPILTPTGGFSQYLLIVTPTGTECALPPGIAVTPYKAIANASWGIISGATPHQVELTTCFSDWR